MNIYVLTAEQVEQLNQFVKSDTWSWFWPHNDMSWVPGAQAEWLMENVGCTLAEGPDGTWYGVY